MRNDKKPPARPRLIIDEPANMDKLLYLEAGFSEWFEKRGIRTKRARRKALIEMAIDMLYAKPEIEELLGKEKLQKLMSQKVKKFI